MQSEIGSNKNCPTCLASGLRMDYREIKVGKEDNLRSYCKNQEDRWTFDQEWEQDLLTDWMLGKREESRITLRFPA